ncbi:MAG: ABC transporter permease [Lachnospiraceae bacterium]|nr:ABC transporter permease [Lachnospiraceae bacterium]
MKNKKNLLATPYLLWSLGFILIPLAMIFYYGLSDRDSRFTFANIAAIVEPENAKALGISVILALIATLICILLAYPLSLIIAHSRLNQSSFMIFVFILPMWMNFLLRTLAWQTLLEKNGVINHLLTLLHLPNLSIINTPYAIVLGMVYNFLPFMILPVHNALSKIDPNVIAAARDLGANSFQTFCYVIFPLTIPGLISGITMVSVPALTTFVISDMLGGGKILLIGNVIEQEFKQANNWNAGSGLSIVLMIFILLAMGMTAKYDREGGSYF